MGPSRHGIWLKRVVRQASAHPLVLWARIPTCSGKAGERKGRGGGGGGRPGGRTHSCQGGPRGPAPAPAAPLPSPAARHVRNRNEAMGVAEDTRICGFSFKLLQQSAQAVANQEGKCGYRPKQQRRPDAITRAGGRGPYQQCVQSLRGDRVRMSAPAAAGRPAQPMRRRGYRARLG